MPKTFHVINHIIGRAVTEYLQRLIFIHPKCDSDRVFRSPLVCLWSVPRQSIHARVSALNLAPTRQNAFRSLVIFGLYFEKVSKFFQLTTVNRAHSIIACSKLHFGAYSFHSDCSCSPRSLPLCVRWFLPRTNFFGRCRHFSLFAVLLCFWAAC